MKYLKLFENSENPKIFSTSEYVSVSYKSDNRLSTCEISHISNNEWYVNRVKVSDGQEGKGIGSIILQSAIKEIKQYNPKSIIVTPGGYSENQEQQFNFYEKNGFIEVENQPGLFYYKYS